MITRLENQNSEVACSCPNCGAVSNVRELLNGCKNCKTRFIMDDLFPKVTNFYFVKTYSLANKSTKKVLAPYLLGRNCRRCGIYGMGGCKGRNF